nr:hypothetical protein Iba_chr09cCG10150 [Ipomoea batatas]
MTDSTQYVFIEEMEKSGYIAISNILALSRYQAKFVFQKFNNKLPTISRRRWSCSNSIPGQTQKTVDQIRQHKVLFTSLPISSINNLIKQQLTEIEADTSVNFKEKSRHLFGEVSVICGGHPIGIGNLVQKGKEGGHRSRSDGRKVLPVMKTRNEERPDEEPCAVAEWEWRPVSGSQPVAAWRHGWFGEVAYVIVGTV